MKPAPSLPPHSPPSRIAAGSRGHSLWRFYVASGATHAALLVALIFLLRPIDMPPKLGELAPINVELVAEAPFETVTLVPPETSLDLLPVLPLFPAQASLPPLRELVQVEGDTQGAPVPAAPAYDPRPIDVQGRVAVGPADDLTRLPPAMPRASAKTTPRACTATHNWAARLPLPYPASALRSHTDGRVLVLVYLDAEGKITEAKPIPDQTSFSVAAMNALKGARFLPAITDEKPHPYWTMLEFVFTIPSEAPVADAAK